MTMKMKILICLGALLGVAAVKTQFELPLAKVTVRVLDEAQKPLPGAQVSLGFKNRLTSDDVFVRGETDSDGRFTGEGGAGPTGVSNEIIHEGYYQGWAPIPKFYEIDPLNHWKPWDQTYTTTLRRIGKPVPLYVRSAWIEIPATGQPCGYDLEKGDWVAPYGKGTAADLVFKLSRRYDDRQNFDVTADVGFTQPLDGIQEIVLPDIGRNSMFKWPREAPESGYVRILKTRFARDPQAGFTQSATDEQAYFFRVRTVERNGRIVSALYGKIRGGLQLAPSNSKTSKVKITYYLNPTSLDRNLEWDTTKNLIPGLKYEETPREP